MKTKRSRACDISKKVKEVVWKRDHHCCIICGSVFAMPNAHFLSRAHGGLGIEENIVTLCFNCHNTYDNGRYKEKTEEIRKKIESYLRKQYPNWSIDLITYKKRP